ncbi:megakaryocyte-associated tyrosine-protein kinase-like [Mya arenaria]|uniref:megakaryocyte-associated tyrosine-protein kinase-like n=1 Tax=Mya arenaria TaxID=6604 RepID=UPI0022DF4BA5|nr:megakaryocyte-associated tyrosine-protein kinase-like [Mya arenaria]
MAGLVNIAAKIGEGHFTEVYTGRLCEQQHVVIKQLRSNPTLQRHHKQLHESLMSGFEVLLKLNGSNLFVNFLGLTLGPSTGLLMSGTGLYSMKAFLRMDRTGPPQLTFLHLIDVSIHLAEALQYMEQKNCFHGNLTCENLVVEKFDHRVLEIKVTDPGLVCFYQQLPLDHEVNIKRLPWLDPSMYKPGGLKEVTAKTEVWALGSTLWQMFEGGASPWEAINSMGGPRSIDADIIRKENRKTPFSNDRPSYEWYKKLMDRNKDIVGLRKEVLLEASRSRLTSERFDKWYSNFTDFLAEKIFSTSPNEYGMPMRPVFKWEVKQDI